MSDFSSGSDRADALLGLALQRASPPDPCPGAEDIAAWHDRRLGRRRQQQVGSHVAHCDDCYGIWSDLLDADFILTAKTTSESASRVSPAGGWRAWVLSVRAGYLAAAIAATIATVMVVPQVFRSVMLDAQMDSAFAAWREAGPHADPGERWAWGGGLASRSVESVPAEPGWEAEALALAFRAGVRSGLEQITPDNAFWGSVRSGLETGEYECGAAGDSRQCRELGKLGRSVGRWASLLHIACAVPADPRQAGFWNKNVNALSALGRQVDQSLPATQLQRFLADWRAETAAAVPRTALCAREASFLTLGLGGTAGM